MNHILVTQIVAFGPYGQFQAGKITKFWCQALKNDWLTSITKQSNNNKPHQIIGPELWSMVITHS